MDSPVDIEQFRQISLKSISTIRHFYVNDIYDAGEIDKLIDIVNDISSALLDKYQGDRDKCWTISSITFDFNFTANTMQRN